MSKIYGMIIRKLKIDPKTLDLSNLGSPKIKVKDKQINFEFDYDITDEDRKNLEELRDQLELTEKQEYALLDEVDKFHYIEKKLGLI